MAVASPAEQLRIVRRRSRACWWQRRRDVSELSDIGAIRVRKILISLGVAFLVAVLVYLVLPDRMYVEKALNVIVASFAVAAVITWLPLKGRGRQK